MNKKLKIMPVIAAFLIVISALAVLIFIKSDKINPCPYGFSLINNDCQTKKTDFECTDKIMRGKGFYVCKHLVDNDKILPEDLSFGGDIGYESDKTYHIAGKQWRVYLFCNKENEMVQMVCNQNISYAEIEEIEEVSCSGTNQEACKYCNSDEDCARARNCFCYNNNEIENVVLEKEKAPTYCAPQDCKCLDNQCE